MKRKTGLRSHPRSGPEKTGLRPRPRPGPEKTGLRPCPRPGPEKTGLRSCPRPGPEKTGLRSHRARDRRTGDRPETGPETDRRNSPAPGPENRRGPETRTGDRPETGPETGRRKSTTITFFTKTGRRRPPDAQPEPSKSSLWAPLGGRAWSLFSGRVFSKP